MKDTYVSLNGKWDIEYLSPEVYLDTAEPLMTSEKVSLENAVPCYFEDMREALSDAEFFDPTDEDSILM